MYSEGDVYIRMSLHPIPALGPPMQFSRHRVISSCGGRWLQSCTGIESEDDFGPFVDEGEAIAWLLEVWVVP